MKSFFQGKIDVFCALYAVLNGLKVTHRIRALQARDIFHETLLGLAQNPQIFKAVLEQKTDYISIVDAMLNIQCRKRSLIVERPFEGTAHMPPSPDEVWEKISKWLTPNSFNSSQQVPPDMPHDMAKNILGRAMVFRFLRYHDPAAEPLNRHWTTAYHMKDDVLYFFDCSLEESAIYSIKKGGFVTKPKDISANCLICIEPHSIRFMAPCSSRMNIVTSH